ncbi:MAG TPA: AI-2E family transporter [Candidatus Paceibacterota bacterium]
MNENRDINVAITSGTVIKTILLLILIAVLYYIKDIVLVVLASVVIASAIEPATHWCIKHKMRRLPSVIGIYLTLGIVLSLLFIFFIPSMLSDLAIYLNSLPDNINLNDLWNPIRDSGVLSSNQTVSSLSERSFSIKEFIETTKYAISGTGEGIFKTASFVFGGALSFVLMIILSFYLAVQEDGVSNFLKIISPIKHHAYIIDLWKRSQRKIGYWMQGQLLLGLIVGILVYLGLMIIGIKHALFLASVAVIFELIPIFGPILAAVPAILIALTNGSVTFGLLVAGLYLIIHQFENHLLYPFVVRKIIGISPIIVILALVIGAKLAGFLGAILAVPIASAFMEWIDDIERDKKKIII